MSINQLMESTASFIKPSTSTAANLQGSAQTVKTTNTTNTTDTTDTQNVKQIPTPIAQQNVDSKPVSDEKVQQAVDQIQNFTDKAARNLKFTIDSDTGKTVVKVLDSQTQEVIRQFPSEEAISIARTLDKVQGLLFSDKA